MEDKKYKIYKNGLSKKIISLVASATMFFEIIGGNVANVIKSPIIGTIETLASDHMETDDDIIITIPDEVESDVKYAIEEALNDYDYFENNEDIKLSDLKKVKSLTLVASSLNYNTEWLSYCDNLDEMEIYINKNNISKLKNIDFSKVKKLKLSQQTNFNVLLVKPSDFGFLQKYHFDELYLNFVKPDIGNYDVLSKVNADTLYISFYGYNHKVNYDAITNVKNLIISSNYPYDIAIDLTKDQIKRLETKGINVSLNLDQEGYNKYNACCDKLDNIYNSLKIDKNDSDLDKINKILIYVLENCEYDPVIGDKIANDEDHKNESEDMYKEGGLTPLMEDKEFYICGNYSSLFSALLSRANIDSYIIPSNTHAWNLVKVDGEYYYFDATWLDEESITYKNYNYDDEGNIVSQNVHTDSVLEAIKNNELIPDDVWYKILVSNAKTLDSSGSHDPDYIPNYIEIATELEEERKDADVKAISNNKFKIKVGTKEYIITGSILVAMMTALGAAIAVSKKKKRNKLKQSYIDPTQPFDYNNFKI